MRADLQEMGNELWGLHRTAFLESSEKGGGTPHTPFWPKVSWQGYSQVGGNPCVSLPSPGPTALTPAGSGRPHQETESRTVAPGPRCITDRCAPAPSPRQPTKQKLKTSGVCPGLLSTAGPTPHTWGGCRLPCSEVPEAARGPSPLSLGHPFRAWQVHVG